MFEKLEEEIEVKADEYALEESTACNYGESRKHVYQGYFYGFKKGAEFGYNKANEWHYVKDGDLPKEDTSEKETLYLLWLGLDDSDYISGLFSQGRFWCFDCGWFETNEVVAWKEIVPPKEIKEND